MSLTPPTAAQQLVEPTRVLTNPKKVWGLFGVAFLISFVTNILALVQPVYMLHVYDYVLSSQSIPTLSYLTAIAMFLMALLGVLDFLRGRVLAQMALEIDAQVRERAFLGAYERALASRRFGRSSFSTDLDTVRGFLSGPGITSLMDLPWTPIFIIVLMALSPLLGIISIFFAVLVAGAVLFNQNIGRRLARQSLAQNMQASRMAEDMFQAADAVESMGFAKNVLGRWAATSRKAAETNNTAAGRNGMTSSAVKALRISLQILSLGVAALLVIDGKVTAGAMFAASIIGARALQPVDQVISAWRNISSTRLSWANLAELVREHDRANSPKTELPAPKGSIKVEGVAVGVPPNSILIQNVSLEVPAGAFLGIVGPSGSGKTTLARAIAGAVPLMGGVVRVDGADVKQWERDKLGRFIGYLPQSVHLLQGTVAETIRRFGPVDDEGVILAAKRAGAHDMITRLPKGYDTDVGDAGSHLSGGQRARVGLARAFYGDPRIVIMDEPFAHLDAEGEAATVNAMREARQRGVTVILVGHRPSEIAGFDLVAVMQGGRLVRFGPIKDVLPTITSPAAAS